MKQDLRIVAMSNSPDVPAPAAASDDTVDAALKTVEHQISVFWRRARSVSHRCPARSTPTWSLRRTACSP